MIGCDVDSVSLVPVCVSVSAETATVKGNIPNLKVLIIKHLGRETFGCLLAGVDIWLGKGYTVV